MCLPWQPPLLIYKPWRYKKSYKGGRKKVEPSLWWLQVCCDHRMEAPCSPQSSFSARYWSPRGGTEEVEQRQKHRPDWRIRLTKEHIYYTATTGRPLCIHSTTTTMRPSSLLPHLSDLWAINLLCDPCATVLNTLKTLWQPWGPLRGINILCTMVTIRPPLSLHQRPGQLYGRTREAQRWQALCNIRRGVVTCPYSGLG